MVLSYEKSGDTITITVQDPNYRKTGSWKFNTADKELGEGILKHLMLKYGFSPEIKPKEHIDSKEKELSKEKNWLDTDINW
jgi:hypothetical protein